MDHIVQATIALLAIANPIGAAPLFSSFTESLSESEQQQAAVRATIAVFIILTLATLAGHWVLKAFGISIPAFQAAGGLVVLLMGLEMLRGSPTKVQFDNKPEADREDSVLVPFAMPLIAGPGAITTVITLSTRGHVWWTGTLVSLIAIVVTCFVLLLALRSSAWLVERISDRAHRIFLRFMGLILLAVGAQLLLTGIHSFLLP